MKKRTKKLMLLPIVGILGGCFDVSNDVVQRDIYQSKEDCIKDWEDEKLCEPQITEEAKNEINALYSKVDENELTKNGNNQTVASNNQVVSSTSNSAVNNNTTTQSSSGSGLNNFATGYLVGSMLNGGNSSNNYNPQTSNVKSNYNYAGPAYYEGNRAVQTSDGKIVKPTQNHSNKIPFVVQSLRDGRSSFSESNYSKPVSNSSYKSSSSSSNHISRGGFSGRSGASSGG